MGSKKKLFLVLMFLYLSTSFLQAQNYLDYLNQANACIKDMKYKVSLKYKAYGTYTSTKALQEKNCKMTVWGEEMSMDFDGIEVVKNKHKSIHVDHSHKIVILDNVLSNKQKRREEDGVQAIVNIDSLILSYVSIDSTGATSKTITLRMHFAKSNRYKYSDITINRTTHFIEKVVVYYNGSLNTLLGRGFDKKAEYNQAPRLEVVFVEFAKLNKRPSADFRIEKYIKAKGNKNYLLPEFDGYKFYDNTSKKR